MKERRDYLASEASRMLGEMGLSVWLASEWERKPGRVAISPSLAVLGDSSVGPIGWVDLASRETVGRIVSAWNAYCDFLEMRGHPSDWTDDDLADATYAYSDLLDAIILESV
jgi:hypothetical protein